MSQDRNHQTFQSFNVRAIYYLNNHIGNHIDGLTKVSSHAFYDDQSHDMYLFGRVHECPIVTLLDETYNDGQGYPLCEGLHVGFLMFYRLRGDAYQDGACHDVR